MLLAWLLRLRSMLSTAEVAAYRNDVGDLTRLAERDLDVLTRDVSSGREMRELLEELLPGLVALYGAAAAALASDWYDEVREAQEVRGFFRAIPAVLPDEDRTRSLAGWATGTALTNAAEGLGSFTEDRAVIVTKAGGGLQRIVVDAARETVMTSSVQDPRARGWQRIGSGECGFCTVLIRRGAVYSERSATFASHDHCRCAAVPSFDGTPLPVNDYVPTGRRVSDADRARTRDYIRAQGLTP